MDREFPTIQTDRLLLRRFTENDLPRVFKGLSDPEVIRYYGVSFPTLEATREQMKWFAELEENGTSIWWAVCSRDNRTFYGTGGLNSLSKEHRKAEIGFWLLPQFWGERTMTQAVPCICRYGFEILGLHRIEAFVESENRNCKKALSRLGFRKEGTMRDCEIKNGAFIGLDLYSRLSCDR